MKNWQKVIEYYNQSCHFNIFALEFYKICTFFVKIQKSSLKFRQNLKNAKLEQSDGHGKVMEKLLTKSVETLNWLL